MKNKKFLIVLITFIVLMLSSTMVYAAESTEVISNAERFKWFTLIPPLVAIIYRNTYWMFYDSAY